MLLQVSSTSNGYPPQRLLGAPGRQAQGGDQAFFVFQGFMNEMNEDPFKAFQLLGKNGIEIIPNKDQKSVFIWSNPVLIW